MALFDFLTKPVRLDGRAPASRPPQTVRRPVAVAAAAVAPAKPVQRQGAGATVTPIRSKPAAAAAAGAPPNYKSVSDLPQYTEVVSLAGKRFAVGTKSQESLFVLKLTEVEGLYTVVATRESFGSAAYKGMVKRIEDDGCRVAYCGTADGALINKVNKEGAETGQTDEKHQRIVRDIDKLAQDALDADASDIHIEKRNGSAAVKLRVNGRLELHSDSWDAEYVDRMARALHTIADDDSKPQTFSETCQMSVTRKLPSGAPVKLRVQVSQAYPDGGLDIVIRVLRVAVSAKVKQLHELGYAPEHIEMLEYMQSSPGGLTIIAGTTGSGKSTTLQTLMQNIRKQDKGLKMISIEDPPEYVMEGVTQIPVARRRDQGNENPFTQAMRSTMRMDPDVIMIGEIRDQESGALTVSMVQSGHKALGTIHTESALGVIGRLQSMGIDRDVLGARRFISGLIYQTLVPLLCPRCKIDYDPTDERISPALHERIKHVVSEGDTIFIETPGGCPECNHRGIVGRTVCAEMVIPDNTILECIRKGDMAAAYTHWRSQRAGKPEESMAGATALDHGILKMLRGEVSPQAVESALGLLHDFTLETNTAVAEVSDLLGFDT